MLAVAPLRYCPVTVVFAPVRANTVEPLTCGSRWVTGWPESPADTLAPGSGRVRAAPRPPPLVVTHRALSVVATHKLTVAQDTSPSSLAVSEVTAVHPDPPSLVPRRATSVPAPAVQQCCTSGQLSESSQLLLSSVSTPPQ